RAAAEAGTGETRHGLARPAAERFAGTRAMNIRRTIPDIAIAGGGMIGAACALALATEGSDVVLSEARAHVPWRAEDREDLRVIALAPSSAKLLDDLGVGNTVRDARVSPSSRMH